MMQVEPHATAPVDALAALRGLASRFLGGFLSPGCDRARLCAALRPDDDDYALAFAPGAEARARAGYRALWAGAPSFGPTGTQTRLSVAVAWSDELARGAPRSRAFPEGYRRVGPLLRPGRIWASWAFVEPGGAGTIYDGLVFLGRRWAWFPQPWRFVSPAPIETAMDFWAE